MDAIARKAIGLSKIIASVGSGTSLGVTAAEALALNAGLVTATASAGAMGTAAASSATAVSGALTRANRFGILSAAAASFRSGLQRITPVFQDIAAASATAAAQIKSNFDKVKGISEAGSKITTVGRQLSTFVTLPILGLGFGALRAAGNFEQLEISYGTMLGSAEKGKKLIEELTKFSAATPFELPGITDAARQLLAAAVPAEQITERLTFLGNIASGTTKPIEEIASIYAKTMLKGKAKTEELYQFAERGIPIIETLRQGLKLPDEASVFDAASKGMISADIITKALAKIGGEGGLFGGLMAKQSLSLFGLFSTTADGVSQLGVSVGTASMSVFDLKNRMSFLIKKLEAAKTWFDKINKDSPGTAKAILLTTFAFAVLGPMIGSVGLALRFAAFSFAGFKSVLPILRLLKIVALSAFKPLIVGLWKLSFGIVRATISFLVNIPVMIASLWRLSAQGSVAVASLAKRFVVSLAVMSWSALSFTVKTTARVIASFAIMAASTIASAIAMSVSVIGSFIAMSAAFFATPFGLVIGAIALIAAGAYLLYDNWDSVIAWFGSAWDSVLNWLSNLDIVGTVLGWGNSILSAISGWDILVWIATKFTAAVDWLASLNLYDIGIQIIKTLYTGMLEKFKDILAFGGKIKDWFGSLFGDASPNIDITAGQNYSLAPSALSAEPNYNFDPNAFAAANELATPPINDANLGAFAVPTLPSGSVDVNINLSGATENVQAVKTRSVSKGNLGINMARSGPGL